MYTAQVLTFPFFVLFSPLEMGQKISLYAFSSLFIVAGRLVGWLVFSMRNFFFFWMERMDGFVFGFAYGFWGVFDG